MTESRLHALSPLDGRYADKCADLAALFSEAALISRRVRVEAAWFRQLAASGRFPALPRSSADVEACLSDLQQGVDAAGVARVKEIERETSHDVKAVEYYVRERLRSAGAAPAALEFVHFCCTSEDVNNLAYALMLGEARERCLLPALAAVQAQLSRIARRHAALPMLSRTHGQPASPTTLGKEAANFEARIARAAAAFQAVEILGKFNGAVGCFNAHVAADPGQDWRAESRRLIAGLGLAANELTTQIEPHDWVAAYCDALARANTILVDLCRDAWGYVSLGYFAQRAVEGEVGSSTMPHKVNPIAFENAEGNAGIANAMLRHFSDKLPVSRWQRDLTDSTVMRNLGTAFGHTLLAWRSAQAGFERIEPDPARIAADLDAHWEVLGEAIQTVLRAHGVAGGYEKLKAFTRGRDVGANELREFVATLGLPADARERLANLTPSAYTGLAEALARSS
jgi:adenylosuccinate lyase